jgi:myosin-5
MGELKRLHAALVIQTAWRGYVARRAYRAYLKNITTVQNKWRSRPAKRELRRLRQAARDSSKLLKDKRTLELRVKVQGPGRC